MGLEWQEGWRRTTGLLLSSVQLFRTDVSLMKQTEGRFLATIRHVLHSNRQSRNGCRWLRHYAAVIKATRSRNLFVFLQQNLQTNETPSLENKQTLVSFFLSSWWLCDVVSHTYTHIHTNRLTSFLCVLIIGQRPAFFLSMILRCGPSGGSGNPPPTHPTNTHTYTPPLLPDPSSGIN